MSVEGNERKWKWVGINHDTYLAEYMNGGMIARSWMSEGKTIMVSRMTRSGHAGPWSSPILWLSPVVGDL